MPATSAFGLLGPDHPDTLKSMTNLADLLMHLGKRDEARKLFEQTLESSRRVLGPDHVETLGLMNNLANVLREQGRQGDARTLYEQTVEASRRVLGPEHTTTLKRCTNWRERSTARASGTRAANSSSRRWSPAASWTEHPATLKTVMNLAIVLRGQGRPDEARKINEQTLEIQRRVLGPEHPDSLATMENLATVLRDLGKRDEARKLHEQTLEASRRVLGPEHPDTLDTLDNLISLLRDQGERDEVRRLYEQELEIHRRVLGPEDPGTLHRCRIWPRAGALGKPDGARTCTSSARASSRVFGPEHPDTLRSMANLALARVESAAQGRRGPHSCIEQTLEMPTPRPGPGAPRHAVRPMDNLAVVLGDQGKDDEARKLNEQVLEIRHRVLGPDHPLTLWTISRIATGLRKQDKHAEALAPLGAGHGCPAPQPGPRSPDLQDGPPTSMRSRSSRPQASRTASAARGLEVARKALELSPDDEYSRQSLGWVRYPAGDWKGCIQSEETDEGLRPRDGDFFAAMAHWRLGEKAQARMVFDRAGQVVRGVRPGRWIERRENGQYTLPDRHVRRQIRAEAAALLGVGPSEERLKPRTASEPTSSPK